MLTIVLLHRVLGFVGTGVKKEEIQKKKSLVQIDNAGIKLQLTNTTNKL